MRTVLVVLVAIFLSGMAPAMAERGEEPASVASILDEHLSTKREKMGRYTDLSSEEEQKFWPLYDSYESEMRPVLLDLMSLLDRYEEGYESISEAEADEIIEGLRNSARKSIKIQGAYLQRFRKILPAKKVLHISAVIYDLVP